MSGSPTLDATLRILRTALLSVYLFGTIGAGAELLLLEHTEDFWQLVPLVLMGTSLIVVGWWGIQRSHASLRTFQVTMIAFIVSGGIGLILHYRGNAEFELEMYPSLAGFGLFWEAIKGATPTLAPGTMALLGLIGLAYSYRHPVLSDAGRQLPGGLG